MKIECINLRVDLVYSYMTYIAMATRSGVLWNKQKYCTTESCHGPSQFKFQRLIFFLKLVA
jgi:hypothetical protein